MSYERKIKNDAIHIQLRYLTKSYEQYSNILGTTETASCVFQGIHHKDYQDLYNIADRILLTACKEFAQWVNENIINDQSKK